MSEARNRRAGSDLRRGYTLVELMISSVAATMLLAGMTSAVFVATKAMSPPPEHASVLEAAETSAILADDIQSAIHILDHDSSHLEFALADRDGDGNTETIAYSFDELTGHLKRTAGTDSGVIADGLFAVDITATHRSVSEDLGGQVSASAPGTLAGVRTGGDVQTFSLDPYRSAGQFVDFSHPADTVHWSIESVTVALSRNSWWWPGEQLRIQICEATGDGLPTANVLAESSLPISTLSTTPAWKTVMMTGAERLLPTQKVCILVLADDQLFGYAGRVAYTTGGFTPAGSGLATFDGGATWYQASGASLYFNLSGTRHSIDGTSHVIERDYITGYDISLTSVESPDPVRRRVRLLNTPENLEAAWRLDFNVDPSTDIDVDFDGVEDWTYTGSGSFNPTILGSVLRLSAEQSFQTSVKDDFAGVITLDLHCRAVTSSDSGGATVEIPFGADDGTSGLVRVSVTRNANGSQAAQVTAADGGSGQVLALLNSLPDETVEVRMVIDPAANQAAVWVNEVFQGRTTVSQPLATGTKHAMFGAVSAIADFDFLSLRVGGVD